MAVNWPAIKEELRMKNLCSCQELERENCFSFLNKSIDEEALSKSPAGMIIAKSNNYQKNNSNLEKGGL